MKINRKKEIKTGLNNDDRREKKRRKTIMDEKNIKNETKIKLVTGETEERNIRQKYQKGRKLVKNKKTKKE